MAVHYPADIELFSLVRTDSEKCLFPDASIRKQVSDRIGHEFIGTLEQDEIIYTMLDLEQYIGRKIQWISPKTFEDVLASTRGTKPDGTEYRYLPNVMMRYCTTELKVKPITQWLYDNTELPVRMRMGFRASEQERAQRMLLRQTEGIEYAKVIVGKSKSRNKWKDVAYRVAEFPLIEDNIYKDTIEAYWQDKPVRFAYMNNCVGCFHRSPMLLKHMSDKAPNKFDWFIEQEQHGAQWKKETTYAKIKAHKSQHTLFDDDFNSCDSGYCGL
jgi:hypothetical protein